MALQKTRWSPDTCGCVVEYEWDDSLSENQRAHNVKNIITQCPAHAGKSVAQIHTTLFDENPRKNKLLGRLAELFTELTESDTSGNVVLKQGVVSWSYDANRVLQITIPSISQQKKNQAQSWADTNLGAGKVKVN